MVVNATSKPTPPTGKLPPLTEANESLKTFSAGSCVAQYGYVWPKAAAVMLEGEAGRNLYFLAKQDGTLFIAPEGMVPADRASAAWRLELADKEAALALLERLLPQTEKRAARSHVFERARSAPTAIREILVLCGREPKPCPPEHADAYEQTPIAAVLDAERRALFGNPTDSFAKRFPRLIATASDGRLSNSVRVQAIELLTGFPTSEPVFERLATTFDEREEVRRAAEVALAKLRNPPMSTHDVAVF